VLLAEDNLINQTVAKKMLTQLGMVAVVAANGAEAVDAVTQPGSHFDVVLMDMAMPVMGGVSATKVWLAVCSLPGTPHMVLIAVDVPRIMPFTRCTRHANITCNITATLLTVVRCWFLEHPGARAGGAHRGHDGQRERQGSGRVPGRRHGWLPVQARAEGSPGRGRACRRRISFVVQSNNRLSSLSKPALKVRLAEVGALAKAFPVVAKQQHSLSLRLWVD
jgi:hypothetical protein